MGFLGGGSVKVSLWFSFISYTFSSFMVSPYLGLYALSLGADKVLVGVLYALFTLSTLAGRIPFAKLSERVGQIPLMISGLIVTSLGIFSYLLARIPYELLIGSVLRGLGFSIYHPSALTLSVGEDVVESRKTTGLILTGPPLGILLGSLTAAALVETIGIAQVFIGGAIAPILGSIGLLRAGTRDGSREISSKTKNKIFNKTLFSVMAGRFVLSYSAGSVVAFLPIMARENMGLRLEETGLLFTLAAFFNMLGRPTAGYVSEKLSERISMMIGLSSMATACILLTLPHPLSTWIGAGLYGLAQGLFIPASVLLVARVVPQEVRTMAFAYVTTMVDIGISTGSFFSGVIASAYGITSVFLTSSIISLLGVSAFYTLSRNNPPSS